MNSYAGIILLLVGLVYSDKPEKIVTITKQYFPDKLVIYTSEHDIVKLLSPVNSLNFDAETDFRSIDVDEMYTFFVEADVTNDKYDYKGLYVLKNKTATKLLDNGRDFAAAIGDESKTVYLAATDGIYVYNVVTNAAEKYGSITESFIGIAAPFEADFIYGLTENHILYKITNEGTKMDVVSDVKDAVQIVVDCENHLFFMNSKKDVYVKGDDESVTKVKGLPHNTSFAKLIRPPFVMDSGIGMVLDHKFYELSPNGTSEYNNINLEVVPTAYSVDASLFQYYAIEKKIYEYQIYQIMNGKIEFDELKKALAPKTEDIKAVGNKSRKSYRPK